ncbi:hypothetical protein ACTXT7_012656 [Hymenolepis weldensis]
MRRCLEGTQSISSKQSPTKCQKEEINFTDAELYGNIKDYDLTFHIGEGAFGEAFKATDKETRQLFAIKMLISRFQCLYNSIEIRFLNTWKDANLVEMLWSDKVYSSKINLWSVGWTFAQLILRKLLLVDVDADDQTAKNSLQQSTHLPKSKIQKLKAD